MSVSWQPNFRPTYLGNPLTGGGAVGTHNTSSGDYGNWFGSRPPLNFPLPRKIPTRKLGALNVTDADTHHSNAASLGNPYMQSNDLDQTGKVTSFLSKVNGESRVPRSPRTPDLIDLPGRLVRAPRTRHMTPRNSPDLYERVYEEDAYHKEGMVGDVTRGFGHLTTTDVSRGQSTYRPEPTLIERGHSFVDWSSDNKKVPNDTGIYGLDRSRTMVDINPNSTLNPVTTRDYVIPKFPLERSHTQPNFMERSNTSFTPFGTNQSNSTQFWNNHEAGNSHLQRSHTMPEGSTMTPRQSNANDIRPGWNFRRVPSFHGNLPGGNMPPQRAEDIQQPSLTNQYPVNNNMSRYMFTMAPNSNVAKNGTEDISEQGSIKPRIPMYWLYGSRGRPNIGSDIPIRSSSYNDNIPLDNSQVMEHERRRNSLADSVFLAGASDRRDTYRSNYSSFEDHRRQNESEISEPTAASQQEANAGLDGPKIKSILKKTPSLQGHTFPGVSSSRVKAGPGGRLPHLNPAKRKDTKRVKFSF